MDHFLIVKEKKLTNLPRSDRLERSRNPHDNFFETVQYWTAIPPESA